MINSFKKKLNKLINPSGFYLRHSGFCVCCDSKVEFVSNSSWLRDNLKCSNCGSIPRERALMLIIERYYPGWRDLSIHESSPAESGASIKLKQCLNYTPSQYYPDKPLGSVIQNFINEDLEQQTFQDESFDIVVTQDVMEHIYNPEKAFSEIARTLKEGGAHIFTIPIVNKHNPSELWAVKNENGGPKFLKDPEYHGNPINPNGSPVTMHWGYDIVDFIKLHCGLETTIEYLYNLDYGISAEYIEVLVSKKKTV